VNARVLVRTDKNVMTIPSSAVQLGPNGPFTYVIKSDSTVEARPLRVAEDANGVTIVTSGLTSSEQVVTSNQYRLQAGSHVHIAANAS
jgi:multidrug efflux system membrane fusion protein